MPAIIGENNNAFLNNSDNVKYWPIPERSKLLIFRAFLATSKLFKLFFTASLEMTSDVIKTP